MTGRRRLAPHLSPSTDRAAAIGAGQARTYEPSNVGKTDPATSCFQEDLYALALEKVGVRGDQWLEFRYDE